MMLLVTCEHGGNRIPREYRHLFEGYEAALASHRGHDPGALALASDLAGACGAPLVASTVSRLLVELNRSPGHRGLYSERTRDLAPEVKARIATRYYEPYRHEVERRVREGIAAGRCVFHLSSHSFTPALHGVTRNADVGFLYDPGRRRERRLCEQLSTALAERIAPLRVRRNYPYRGYNDGLTTFLRRRFRPDAYLGVEIEVNQKHALRGGRPWHALRRSIVRSVLDVLEVDAPWHRRCSAPRP
jgi:predicted N-formylglutamate amidohydrolase